MYEIINRYENFCKIYIDTYLLYPIVLTQIDYILFIYNTPERS